ncbi:MAG TPA: CHAT domain-containing tetratricopeptide repeat protein [Fimbriimonadaceae bacterium]|nr:CHAT domain-containing tetratricopeptide repeat protein [Fimbriimonadaceae bacterium]
MLSQGLLLVVLLSQPASLPKLVGTLSVAEGKVRLERTGRDPQWAGRYVRLRVGDKITVVEKPKATLRMDLSRETFRLPEKGAWQVEERSLKVLEGAALVLLHREKPIRQTPGAKPPTMAGRIRGDDSSVKPVGAIVSGPITVTWNPAAGVTKTVVELLDGAGKKLWSKRAGKDPSLGLPGDKVKPGVWVQVRVTQSGAGSPSVGSTWVRLMSPAERSALEAAEKDLRGVLADDPVALGLALGDVWASAGLVSRLQDALAVMFPEFVARPNPSSGVKQDWHGKHGEWLEVAGFPGLALAEFERAWKAGGRVEELKLAIERLGGKAEPEEWERLAAERDRLMAERKFAEALPVARKVVEILREFTLELPLASALRSLGRISYSEGYPHNAESAFRESVSIYERLLPDSADLATSVTDLGFVAHAMGNFDDAERFILAAVSIQEGLFPGTWIIAYNYFLLADISWRRGDLQTARRRYLVAYTIYQRTSQNSEDLALTAHNLGVLAWQDGDLEEALRRWTVALEIRRQIAPDSLRLAESLSNMSALVTKMGDLEKGGSLCLAALSIFNKHAPGSMSCGRATNNLGLIALESGQLEIADRHFRSALAIFEKLAPDSFEMAGLMGNLGRIAHELGNLEEARTWCDRSASILGKIAPGTSDFALSQHLLGIIARDRQDYSESERLFRSAADLRHRICPGTLDEAQSLTALGVVASDKGDLNEGRRSQEAALAIQEKVAPNSLDVLFSLVNLGIFAAERGDHTVVSALSGRSLELVTTLLTSQGLSRAGELGSIGAETNKSLLRLGWLDHPESSYPWLPTLRAAGLTLQTRAKISEKAAETDEEVRKARSAVQIATKQETDWVTSPRPKEMDEKTWNDQLIDLRSKRQSAELALATLLKAKDPRLGADLKIKLEDVQKNLAKDAALVEFLRVSTWDKKGKDAGPDAYAAFIVRNQGEVKFVRLGGAETIDDLVEQWHLQIALANDPNAPEATQRETEKELKVLGRKLHDKLIKPLGKLPPSVMLAPDSVLHSLPFVALVDGKGKYLIETMALSVVGSGRDLVEKPIPGEPGEIAVLAGPDFGATATALQAASASLPKSPITRAPNARGEWDPLPSASAEGARVATLLGAKPIEGAAATEERLLSLVRPRVLHIATHGFFYPPNIDPRDREDRMMSDMTGRGIRAADNPMIRSGLVMAGANQEEALRQAGLADGWATALEISLMDLRGTELVVLSACDTGRGDSIGSEGVFGLQRAFRFAGAQSLLVSLFKVPDASTQSLMTRFYGAWKPGAPAGTKLEALRDTQLAMLADPQTRHPRHWSAFVLMGER